MWTYTTQIASILPTTAVVGLGCLMGCLRWLT